MYCPALLKLRFLVSTTPEQPVPSMMPASVLWSVTLATTSEDVVVFRVMPRATRPLMGWPAKVTWLPSNVMFAEPLT